MCLSFPYRYRTNKFHGCRGSVTRLFIVWLVQPYKTAYFGNLSSLPSFISWCFSSASSVLILFNIFFLMFKVPLTMKVTHVFLVKTYKSIFYSGATSISHAQCYKPVLLRPVTALLRPALFCLLQTKNELFERFPLEILLTEWILLSIHRITFKSIKEQ